MKYRMAAALALLVRASSCTIYIGDWPVGDDPGYPTDPDYPYPPPPPPLPPPDDCALEAPRILDCGWQNGYVINSFRPYNDSRTKLHLLGVYATPTGQAFVDFAQPGSNVMALSAYAATEWNVKVTPEAGLEKIVVIGYEPQTVNAPEGVPVEIHSLAQGEGLFGCGYQYPSVSIECKTEELIAIVERLTGLPLAAFDGCYDASQLQVAPGSCDPPPPPPPPSSCILDTPVVLDCNAAQDTNPADNAAALPSVRHHLPSGCNAA